MATLCRYTLILTVEPNIILFVDQQLISKTSSKQQKISSIAIYAICYRIPIARARIIETTLLKSIANHARI